MAGNNKAKKKNFEKDVEQWTEKFESAVEAKKERFEAGVERKKEGFEKGVEQRKERFEKFVDATNDGFKRTIVTWLRTSQFFDGMVNTPARILINVLSIFVLYVWGFMVFESEDNFIPWMICLVLLLGMQAASVRFVFNTQGVADEFQLARRDTAYRRAYRVLRRIPTFVALFIILLMLLRPGELRYTWELISYRLDNLRSLAFAVFLIGVVSFQKYFSYGWKGEPFTVREKRNIKD